MDNNYFGVNELKALQDLINPPKNESDSEEDLTQSKPGKIILEKKLHPHASLEKDKNEIWNPREIINQENVQLVDPRSTPEYEMKFKQSVGPEDVFLGMGFKTPGTASCEWLSVMVKLPGEIKERIELSVETETIDVRAEKYRLHLPTPHTVDPNGSSAKWHPETSTLEITLKLMREFDNVNF